MARTRWEDADYMADTRAILVRGPRWAATLLLALVVYLVVLSVYWANKTVLDEVTRGNGTVIPSSQVQVVQNLEGGILSEIHIAPGDVVEAGQVLLRIDNTSFQSSFQENRGHRLALLARMTRLTAEVENAAPAFPDDVTAQRPDLIDSEMALYRSRGRERDSGIAILQQQAQQRQQELKELHSKARTEKTSYEFANEELKITAPLVKRGVMSKVELLRLKRQVGDLKGALEQTRLAIPRVTAAIAEAERRIEEKHLNFQTEALTALNEAKNEYASLTATIVAAEDRVQRTAVRSPVKGTVKQLKINTIGGVIRPGEDLAEIVPLEDRLLIEARIRPSDIAFIHAGQRANVKITAYDFAVYGGLDATVEQISADAIAAKEADGESFFLIRLRTDRSFLGPADEPLPIIPGMIASVDILTGEKTVLTYLLKPILRAYDTALREC